MIEGSSLPALEAHTGLTRHWVGGMSACRQPVTLEAGALCLPCLTLKGTDCALMCCVLGRHDA